MNFAISAAVAILAVVLTIALRTRRRLREKGFPPGPDPLPLLGNVHQVNSTCPRLTFTEWKRVYGDIVYCSMLGREFVIVNSEKVAEDLMDKRSRNYSNRMDMYGLISDTVSLNHDDLWRAHRRVLQQTLRPEALVVYRHTQLRCAATLLQNLHDTPSSWWGHIRTFSAATIMGAMYDHDLPADPKDDKAFCTVVEGKDLKVHLGSLGMISLLTVFPMLKYVPTWFPVGRYMNAAKFVRAMDEMIETPYDILQKRTATGEARPCVISEALSKFQDDSKLDNVEQVIKHASGEETVGSNKLLLYQYSPTSLACKTGSTLLTFTLAMVLHPHVQKLAQDEIDKVIGVDRLPYFNDKPDLPYLEAVFRETLRWRPVAPLGIPHAATNEDVYEGYYIPKGNRFINFIRAMAQDKNKYPSPDTFDPSRFFDSDGQLTNDTCEFVFGFGRRVCPGRHFAQASVWTAMAHILATFSILRDNDASGEPIEPAPDWAEGVTW
ncbi:cytochrome P450 [Coniophora puteana RWD-64-598 SS2]|uniref:Cytochrome P450 n=1 Tax=Coniophora puteana (strain RWD-64-598) TaxID=741705 RepID=A0A5M3MZ97_CONPW|nr:cytochrome P450 [Coniophora puteana RWD-64-598 SS2]EIW84493.1 cytochrome P450 [Coniophora puteana RWD-64-598 SS2]